MGIPSTNYFRLIIFTLLLLIPAIVLATVRLDEEGASQGFVKYLDCVGAGISCSKSGITGTLTVAGGGAATVTVQEDDSTVDASVDTLDFGAGFDVTSSPAGEANIVLDYTEDPVTLTTDTDGNYTATIADAGNSTIAVVNGVAEGGAVTLDAVDLNCTDCIGTTEIADSYLLNSGDATTGDIDFNDGATDSPKATFTPATGTAWDIYVEDGGDDLQIETTTAAVETIDVINTGAGTINVRLDGDLSILGDDLIMTTNTDGAVLVADGTNFNPVDMSGDVDIDNTGATTIQADSVALTTDTTGNYVADVADGTGIDGTASGEGATYTPTLDLTEISSTTWGAGSFTTMTFDAGATDPVITASSGELSITTGDFSIDNNSSLKMYEGNGGGSNFKAFAAPATLTADTTCTFEDDANFIPDSCVGDGTDDDVPESGDFGNAADLDADGNISADVITFAEISDSSAIDADTTFTAADGIQLTLTPTHTNGDTNFFTINGDQTDDADGTDDFDAIRLDLTSESGDTGDTFDGIVLIWENGTANTVMDAGIKIDNAETTASTMTDAIIVTSSGVSGGVVDAVDVSAANITNAINIGANNIITGAATIASTELDLLDGMTAKTGADTSFATGTAGASGNCAEWNVDGDLVDSGAACGGGSSEWTDTGTVLHPSETGDDVALGNTTLVNSSKLSIDGDADQVQLTVQGFSSQTDSIVIVENSSGTEVVNIDVDGTILTAVGLDAIGAVDMDYGSGDVTDHTFTTDGTGDAEIVLPSGSISSGEILDDTIVPGDVDETQDYSFATLSGKQDRNNTLVDDDDCTGEQGLWWYDTTDSAFEFCDASSGAPSTLGGGSGDVTDVGPGCSTGACFTDGLATTGSNLLIWEGTGVDTNEFTIAVPSNPATDQTFTFPDDELADDDVILANGAGAAQYVNVPDCTDSGGNHLNYTASSNSFSCGTSSSSSDTNAEKLYSWAASSLDPTYPVLTGGDGVPPLAQDTDTNQRIIVVDFDDTADECRGVQFFVPNDVDTAGTATFQITWYPATASTSEAVFDFRWHEVNDSEDWDGTLTTDSSDASNCAGTSTQDQVDECTFTETLSNLGWTADETVMGYLCRDGDNGNDALSGDARVIAFSIRVPRT